MHVDARLTQIRRPLLDAISLPGAPPKGYGTSASTRTAGASLIGPGPAIECVVAIDRRFERELALRQRARGRPRRSRCRQQAGESCRRLLVGGVGELVDQNPARLVGECGGVTDPTVRDDRQASRKILPYLVGDDATLDACRPRKQMPASAAARWRGTASGASFLAVTTDARPRVSRGVLRDLGLRRQQQEAEASRLPASSKKSSISSSRYQLPRLPE